MDRQPTYQRVNEQDDENGSRRSDDQGSEVAGSSSLTASTLVVPERNTVTTTCSSELTLTQPSTEKPTRKSIPKGWGWWWEVAGVAASCCCIFIIVGILIKIDNEPLENWRLPIKPNSLISVFSTIAKSALLMPIAECMSQLKWTYFEKPRPLSHVQAYDDASRGPWGSMVFIVKTRTTSILASAAAILTIAMLAFEPTSQQIIEYSTRNVPLSNMTAYMANPKDWSSKGFGFFADGKDPFSLQSWILTGLTNRAMEIKPNFTCQTPECQWPTFESLAVCHSCNTIFSTALEDCNFTVHSEFTENPSEKLIGVFNSSGLHDYLKEHTIIDTQEDKYGSVTIGNMQEDNAVYVNRRFNCTYTPSDGDYPDVVAQPYFGNFSIGVDDPSDPVSNKALVRFSALWTNDDAVLSDPAFFANITAKLMTCELNFCAKRYSGISVHNNIITGGSIENIDLIDAHLRSSSLNDVLDDTTGTLYNVYNTTTGSTYRINEDDISEFWGYLLDLFNVQRRTIRSWELTNYSMDQKLANYLADSDLDEILEGFADALTSIVRSDDNMNLTTLAGSAIGPVVFTQVNWVWLACPVALVALATCLLIFCIVESRSKPLVVKSSTLAFLFYGLDGWRPSEFGSTGGRTEMQETPERLYQLAKGMNAKLEKGADENFKFVKSG